MAVFTKAELCWPDGGMDLAATLFCGQSFSWVADGAAYTGVAGGKAATVWQQDGRLLLCPLGQSHPDDEPFWRHYFALNEDYAAWHTHFGKSAQLRRCVESCPGIRVLNQPFFDTLLSFIISQNNHIPRIAGIVGRLRQHFGPLLAPGVWGLPPPGRLAGLAVEDLACLRAGFRSKYLLDATVKVAAGTVDEARLRAAPTDEARRQLCQIHGVGPKVADCVLLFSLGRKDVAPMDVWMKRAMERYFNGEMPRCAAGGEGIAQQYIFHWMRENAAGREK